MSLLQRIGQESEGALPGAVEQVQGPVHSLPVREMIERVAERLAVPALEDVLRRQDQRLHLQQILGHVGIELHGPVYGLYGGHFAGRKAALAGDVGRKPAQKTIYKTVNKIYHRKKIIIINEKKNTF